MILLLQRGLSLRAVARDAEAAVANKPGLMPRQNCRSEAS
jgi:hypothetical protein